MNFNEKKDKFKCWVKENKVKILLGVGVAATVVIVTMVNGKSKSKEGMTDTNLEPTSDFDPGKDLEMHFVDPENGEVLWKELCTESYMEDVKDWGMQYENTRKLNGIEEA